MTLGELLLWPVHNAGALLVIIGLVIEFIAELHRFEDKPRTRKKLLNIGIWVIIIGVSIEIYESALVEAKLARVTKLAGEANERAARFSKEAEELRGSNLKLYEAIQPRRITKEKRQQLVDTLKSIPTIVPRGTVTVGARRDDLESFVYMLQIADVLAASGFNVETNDALIAGGLSGFGIAYLLQNNNPPPPHALVISKVFEVLGVGPTSVITNAGYPHAFQIWVGSKPLPEP